ncbi:hypothetical protein MPLA_670155 [Mesorhizobium sp. ORS 3359]|nr:hypothetical protein MPLA_670155 [Mesorhizobium sp. ORS 3359]
MPGPQERPLWSEVYWTPGGYESTARMGFIQSINLTDLIENCIHGQTSTQIERGTNGGREKRL